MVILNSAAVAYTYLYLYKSGHIAAATTACDTTAYDDWP